MKTAIVLTAVMLAGCHIPEPPKVEWGCINGLTYTHLNGAWVLVSGTPLIDFPNGPLKCAEPSTAQKGETQ